MLPHVALIFTKLDIHTIWLNLLIEKSSIRGELVELFVALILFIVMILIHSGQKESLCLTVRLTNGWMISHRFVIFWSPRFYPEIHGHPYPVQGFQNLKIVGPYPFRSWISQSFPIPDWFWTDRSVDPWCSKLWTSILNFNSTFLKVACVYIKHDSNVELSRWCSISDSKTYSMRHNSPAMLYRKWRKVRNCQSSILWRS